VWYLEFPWQGVFIDVQGGVTDLIKLVICHVMAGRPSHVAGEPQSPASIDFRLWILYYHLLESVSVKQTHERQQSGSGQPGSLAGWPPPGPLVSDLCTLPPHV
jgi:hypothetical protein